MQILIWSLIFVVSMIVLVKGADWLLVSAEKIGLALGFSEFIIGVTIVGLGTSCPELITGFVSLYEGAPEIVAANALGSNIANILLVVGLAAIVAGRMQVTQSLIDLDLPLLFIGTIIMLGAAWDGQVTIIESIVLLITYGIYLFYTFIHKDISFQHLLELPGRQTRRKHIVTQKKKVKKRPKIKAKDLFHLVIGGAGLALGSKYLVESIITLSDLMNIATGVITITAVALGTSLPELLVSIKAAVKHKSEVALGNVFGSNMFNMFVVIGLPGLFGTLPLDNQTLMIGLPAMAMATIIFVISGISKKVHMWEGCFYLMLYMLVCAKLFQLF